MRQVYARYVPSRKQAGSVNGYPDKACEAAAYCRRRIIRPGKQPLALLQGRKTERRVAVQAATYSPPANMTTLPTGNGIQVSLSVRGSVAIRATRSSGVVT